jgi:hypothetical protein
VNFPKAAMHSSIDHTGNLSRPTCSIAAVRQMDTEALKTIALIGSRPGSRGKHRR